MRSRLKHPGLIAFLIGLILIPIPLALVIEIYDPWGMRDFAHDMRAFFATLLPDTHRSYRNSPGFHQLATWAFTIDLAGNRLIPDSPGSAACTLALLGDSVTFGYGVNDEDSWPNQVAPHLTGVHLINTGVVGYNLQQIYETWKQTPADGYFYLVIRNDADPVITFPSPLALPLAVTYLQQIRGDLYRPAVPDLVMFDRYAAVLKAQDNVLIVGFDMPQDVTTRRATDILLSPWTHTNSRWDGHADAEGNREIADGVLPYLRQLQERVCP